MDTLLSDPPELSARSERQLLLAAMRLNTLLFGVILGVMTGLSLYALALASAPAHGHGALVVALLGVFLPGYDVGWFGGLAGLFWGAMLGGLLGGGIYRINCLSLMHEGNIALLIERNEGDFPLAFLRLDGRSLGLAIGAIGALGLIATTNWLVIRGTAAESVHARLLSEILPGYAVSFWGSFVGAVELFAVMYLLSRCFVCVYNHVAVARHPET
jgi:hypothetical protein